MKKLFLLAGILAVALPVAVLAQEAGDDDVSVVNVNVQADQGGTVRVKAPMRGNVKPAVQAIRKEAQEERKEKMEVARAEMKTKEEARRAELKEKLKVVRSEAKVKLVTQIDAKLAATNERVTAGMTAQLTKLGDILVRVSENGGSAVDVDAAKATIATAQAAVDVQVGKTYTISITSEEKLRADVGAVEKQMRSDLEAVQKLVKAAKEAVRNIINK